jgi:serine/threonine-protein kinase
MSERSKSRYRPILKIAQGGMASVHLATQDGPLGFQRLVAIKKPHPHLLDSSSFRESFIAEGHLASKIHHANVVGVHDIEVTEDSIGLVMEYIEGATVSQLIQREMDSGKGVEPGIAVRIGLDACAGLHAVHESRDEHGVPLGLVHRDISPQNILVGTDGIARITDFGIAKSTEKMGDETTKGALKGKFGYMPPEYLRGEPIDRRADVYALGVVLWEALAGRRLYRGANEAETISLVLDGRAPRLAMIAGDDARAFDDVIARAIDRSRDRRFETADDLREALERAGACASNADVARFVSERFGPAFEERRDQVMRQADLDGPKTVHGDLRDRTIAELQTHDERATVTAARPRSRKRRWLALTVPGALAVVAALTLGHRTEPTEAKPEISPVRTSTRSEAIAPAPEAPAPAAESEAPSPAVVRHGATRSIPRRVVHRRKLHPTVAARSSSAATPKPATKEPPPNPYE